ncbi:MAG: hypothetical protein KBC12_02725 [Candidatus Pacebacteria bacterium]|jgi:hypothetical protein|nr:hypothetical protein [Candidatus Paceibacterota bacterium]MBP9851354.1 hypothetical protein [Candidatus Paceibacterota bacterium]
MNSIQLKQFEERLESLGKFAQDKNIATYKEHKIIDWISDCINLFYEIGVDSVIIRNFLDHFRTKTEKVKIKRNILMPGSNEEEYATVNSIGPFQQEVTFGFYPKITENYILAGSFYYAKVAFSSARNKLKNKISEKRIVPIWLVEQTAKEDRTKLIASSLELIENKYEQEDSDGLITESVTLLDSILNLDNELKNKGKIGNKLRFLFENKNKLSIFGVTEDLVKGINNGRILRNEKIIHKNIPRKGNFPFLIATTFAYMVLHFLECAILNEKLLIKE